MARKPPGQAGAVVGVVKWFDADEGWGVLEAPEYPADVSSTSPASRCPATGSSMQVSVCVSPSSGPDSFRTATPIALWQYGQRHDCRDYQRQMRTFASKVAMYEYTEQMTIQ